MDPMPTDDSMHLSAYNATAWCGNTRVRIEQAMPSS